MAGKSSQSLGSLAGYAMSDSDDDDNDIHKLSGNISGSDDEHSSHSQAASRTYSPVIKDDEAGEKKKNPVISSLGLVSYGGHDEEDSDQELKASDAEEEEKSPVSSGPTQNGVVDYEKTMTGAELVEAANGSPSTASEPDLDELLIPPSPPGPPPRDLVDKIARLCKRPQGVLDNTIQSTKEFRNPSIYEKLLSHMGVDEKGTNYPPELFDPSIWSRSSFYDELAKQQNIEMEKRKNEKKDRVKVDFVTGTKSATTAETTEGPVGKKSKWDNGTQSAQGSTASAAGVNPVGSLIKKK